MFILGLYQKGTVPSQKWKWRLYYFCTQKYKGERHPVGYFEQPRPAGWLCPPPNSLLMFCKWHIQTLHCIFSTYMGHIFLFWSGCSCYILQIVISFLASSMQHLWTTFTEDLWLTLWTPNHGRVICTIITRTQLVFLWITIENHVYYTDYNTYW